MTAIDELRRLSDIAAALGAEGVRADALATAERLSAGRFFVACLGQFKRGTSTLINALVSDAVLPVGVVPVTSVVTVVRYGPARGAIIHFQNGTSTPIDVANISDYVSEAGNPGNRKAVSLVETRRCSRPACVSLPLRVSVRSLRRTRRRRERLCRASTPR